MNFELMSELLASLAENAIDYNEFTNFCAENAIDQAALEGAYAILESIYNGSTTAAISNAFVSAYEMNMISEDLMLHLINRGIVDTSLQMALSESYAMRDDAETYALSATLAADYMLQEGMAEFASKAKEVVKRGRNIALAGSMALTAGIGHKFGVDDGRTAAMNEMKPTIQRQASQIEDSKKRIEQLIQQLKGNKSTISDLNRKIEDHKSTISDLNGQLNFERQRNSEISTYAQSLTDEKNGRLESQAKEVENRPISGTATTNETIKGIYNSVANSKFGQVLGLEADKTVHPEQLKKQQEAEAIRSQKVSFPSHLR